jgi:hypothetical protein
MKLGEGSERNLNGDQPQKWCATRGVTANSTGTNMPPGSAHLVGSNPAWLNFTMPPVTILVGAASWQPAALAPGLLI